MHINVQSKPNQYSTILCPYLFKFSLFSCLGLAVHRTILLSNLKYFLKQRLSRPTNRSLGNTASVSQWFVARRKKKKACARDKSYFPQKEELWPTTHQSTQRWIQACWSGFLTKEVWVSIFLL